MSERTYRFPIEIVTALQEYKQQNRRKAIYDDVITDYLIEYFGRIEHPHMFQYPDIFNIGPYRSKLLLYAIITLESSSEKWVQEFRERWNQIKNGEKGYMTSLFPDNCNVHSSLMLAAFKHVMEESMPEWEIDYSIIYGAWNAISIYYATFIHQVFIGQGMHATIRKATLKGVGGTFGETNLLTWDCAGRLMLTFRKDNKEITFIQESDDPYALSFGVQSCNATLSEAIAMISDVTTNYRPEDFKEDSEIGPGGLSN